MLLNIIILTTYLNFMVMTIFYLMIDDWIARNQDIQFKNQKEKILKIKLYIFYSIYRIISF